MDLWFILLLLAFSKPLHGEEQDTLWALWNLGHFLTQERVVQVRKRHTETLLLPGAYELEIVQRILNMKWSRLEGSPWPLLQLLTKTTTDLPRAQVRQ